MTPTMLFNHVWQSTIAAGLAWLLTIALRRNHAGARYGVWLAASLKFLVPFALLVSAGSSLGWRAMPLPAPAPSQVAYVMDVIGQPFSSPPAEAIRAIVPAPGFPVAVPSLPAAALVLWFAGVAAVLATWVVRWRRVSAIVRAATPAEEGPVFDALRRLETVNAVRTPIALVLSDAPLEPGVFGMLRPVLLWPRLISGHLTETQIEAVVAHEVAHVRRRDNLSAAVHMVVQAVFWFHPLVWWLGARLVDERERACDEAVVRFGSDPRAYAESIIKTCQFYVESPLACVAGVTGSDLKKRIEHIMKHDAGTLSPWKKALLASAAVAAIAGPLVVGLVAAPQQHAQAAGEAGLRRELDALVDRLDADRAALRLAQAAAAAATRPAFDVTSVKPNNSGEGRIGMQQAPGGGWRATNVTLGMMVRIAYQLQDSQIVGGPKWLFDDRFDVLGSGTAPGRDGLLLSKLQTLLEDRFSLVTHTEKRELPMFTLSLARRDGKLGPKMQPSTAADCLTLPGPGGNPPSSGAMSPAQMQRCGIVIGPGRLAGGRLSMAQLATNLSRIVGSVVVDRTGLAGNFELTLEYAPDPTMGGRSDFQGLPPPLAPERPTIDAPSIFSALQEQLGLKLESTKGPVDVLVIDRAEKPTAD